VNDSTGVNRQARHEGQQATDSGTGSPVRLDALAADVAIARPDDRATVFRARVCGSLDVAYRRAAVLLGNRFEAEDAVHDAAERAWWAWGSLRDEARFDAWFGRILVNVCRDRLRRRRRVAVIEVRDAAVDAVDRSAGPQLDRLADRARIVDALAGLSADERVAVVLRYEADLTVPEIARLTGAREGTIKSRLHHALRKLRIALDEGGER
jgi:RNA polymerase sigma-70 factor (ECF subfamily)